MSPLPRPLSVFTLSLTCAGLFGGGAGLARASRVDIPAPPGAGKVQGGFGSAVRLLPNGNVVVVDQHYTPPETGVKCGAVFVYRPDGSLVSRLTGGAAGDRVGAGGVTVLANGNFVVASPLWDSGELVDVGAVTWGSMTEGVSGEISAENSLTGSRAGEKAGDGGLSVDRAAEAEVPRDAPGVAALRNGHYVVCSPAWDGGRGAATWGNGAAGISGEITEGNSLTGAAPGAETGTRLDGGGVVEVGAAHYVVVSPRDNKVTWCDGAAGRAGVATAENSLLGGGPATGGCVTVLSDGDYVVSTRAWNDGRGAVTWCQGDTGRAGEVTAENSLTGVSPGDMAGARLPENIQADGFQGLKEGVVPLKNGDYVVASPYWDRGAATDAGAVTWCRGDGSITGPVTEGNSVTGSTAADRIGRVTALASGNYAVSSDSWDNGTLPNVGAVRVLPGDGPSTGELTAENSLTGSAPEDRVSRGFVVPLTNGNLVVTSPMWKKAGKTEIGAVTWVNGVTGLTGPVTAENSFTGTWEGDQVGGFTEKNPQEGGVVALANGNYVVISPWWGFRFGAVTWGDGSVGLTGEVTAANSLRGGSQTDHVGGNIYGPFRPVPGTAAAAGGGPVFGVTPLANGNYVVCSPNAGPQDDGRVTWCSGAGPTAQTLGATNSLAPFGPPLSGFAYRFALGEFPPIPCPGGDFILVQSSNDGAPYYSSVTPGSGAGPLAGVISQASEKGGALDRAGIPIPTLSGFTDCDPAARRVAAGFWRNGLVTIYGNLYPDLPKFRVTRSAGADFLSGETLDLGEAAVGGGQATAHVILRNPGMVPVTFTAEPPAADFPFALLLPAGENTLPPGGSLRVPVRFTAAGEPGPREGALHLSTGDPDLPDFVFHFTARATASTGSLTRDITAPPGSGAFGTQVTCLPNGNLVITDPAYDAPGPVADVGAVYLYSPEGALLSRITGSAAGERVGGGGVTVLANGNYLIRTVPPSTNPPPPPARNRWALTWADASAGVGGVVSEANSLTGPGPRWAFLTPLPNGDYVVNHELAEDGLGAVTWGSGTAGVSGRMTAENSLTGGGPGAGVITVLPNGNYVILGGRSITVAPGGAPLTGALSAENSLMFPEGTNNSYARITTLTDGNFVVANPTVPVDGVAWTGAVLWVDSGAGVRGAFRPEDALTGDADHTSLGSGGVRALPGGKYGVRFTAPNVNNSGIMWCAAGGAAKGKVDPAKTLLRAGLGGPISPEGNMLLGVTVRELNVAGVAWMNVDAPLTGEPTPANSLYGGDRDRVAAYITLLDDGNFVVVSPMKIGWDPENKMGAVTWVDGRRGRTGPITAENSLMGNGAGGNGVTALGGGRYVVCSPEWSPAGSPSAQAFGAVTWMDGPTDGAGMITAANSIIGADASSRAGSYGAVRLAGGNYLIKSAVGNGSAVTWADGSRASAFQVSAENSLVRQSGTQTVAPLANGNYVVLSRPLPDLRPPNPLCSLAVTWGDSRSGARGLVSAANSVTQTVTNNGVYNENPVLTWPDGAYAVPCPDAVIGANYGPGYGAGAVILGGGDGGAGGLDPAVTGAFSLRNSVRGESIPEGAEISNYRPGSMSASYDPARRRWAVGRSVDNVVTIYSLTAPPPAGGLAIGQAGGADLPDGAVLSFWDLETGHTADRALTLRNTGAGPLRLGALTVDAAAFTVVSGPAEGAELAPGASAEVVLRFTAGSPGVWTGALRVASNDPALPAATVRLRGTVRPSAEWPFGERSAPPEIAPRAEGGATLRFHAVPGAVYELQRSADLVTWELVEEVTADDSGEILFTAPAPAPGAASNFYRLKAR